MLRAFYCDHFVLSLPEGHRFPMAKYRLLRERTLASGAVRPEDLAVPEPATEEEILRVHEAEYLRRVMTGGLDRAELRRIGFPWSPAMVERSRRSAGGTIAACREALAKLDVELEDGAGDGEYLPALEEALDHALGHHGGAAADLAMAGGYGADVRETVEIHLQTVQEARSLS